MSHVPLFSIGLNCALGKKNCDHITSISKRSPVYVSAYPNAGLPNAFGGYDKTPEQMAEATKEYLELGLVNILGGCCGTTP